MGRFNGMRGLKLVYQAVYKCRLCGETYLQKYFDEKEVTEDLDITDLMLNRHKCDNNRYGIADFQGFKSEKEKIKDRYVKDRISDEKRRENRNDNQTNK